MSLQEKNSEKDLSLLPELQETAKSLTEREENRRLQLVKLYRHKALLIFQFNQKPPVQTRSEFESQMKALQKQTREARAEYEQAKFDSTRARKRLKKLLNK